MELLINGHYGIYVPQYFAAVFRKKVPQELAEDFAILSDGPKHPDYWDAWDAVLREFKFPMNGITYVFHQGGSGDVFIASEDETIEE